jgi:serine/threonine-protein kinase
MDRERWPELERLFNAALEIEASGRDAFLDSECGTDSELRHKVELQREQDADSFLETPTVGDRNQERSDRELVPQQLGAYRIVSRLGTGGMGEVYRGHDIKLDRDMALKTLPVELAHDPERLARLRREARILASLNHPNIPVIQGLEESEQADFLIMELVEGETPRAPMPIATALRCASQIAEALEAAHSKDIVHRDLKPSNLKVTPDGRVKVLDFGLARAILAPESRLDPSNTASSAELETVAGHVVGTPSFMSPEQARGDRVDARTDI